MKIMVAIANKSRHENGMGLKKVKGSKYAKNSGTSTKASWGWGRRIRLL